MVEEAEITLHLHVQQAAHHIGWVTIFATMHATSFPATMIMETVLPPIVVVARVVEVGTTLHRRVQ